jgi:hypothetical protein
MPSNCNSEKVQPPAQCAPGRRRDRPVRECDGDGVSGKAGKSLGAVPCGPSHDQAVTLCAFASDPLASADRCGNRLPLDTCCRTPKVSVTASLIASIGIRGVPGVLECGDARGVAGVLTRTALLAVASVMWQAWLP